MPTNLKKMVRARIEKTGESYATALRYLRRRAARLRPVVPPASGPVRSVRIRYPGALRRDPAIDAYVRSVETPLGAVLSRLVSLVRACVPAHDEILFRGAPSFCLGGEPFCYVVGYARHVNLGFCDGASVADPARLLRGKGKHMRHVQLLPGGAFPGAAIEHLVAQSAGRVRARQKEDSGPVKEVRDARR